MYPRTLKGPSDLGANVQSTVCSASVLKRPASGQKSVREDRKHPLGLAPYLCVEPPVGLKSRARARAKGKSVLHFWTNCAVSLVKQLWNGNLNNDFILASAGEMSWDPSVREGDGVHVTNSLLDRMPVASNSRPEGFPRGAAAIRRQQGVSELGHPDLSKKQLKEKKVKIARRGDIWTADVDAISLPPVGTKSTPIANVSEKLRSYIENFQVKMMKSPEECKKLRKLHKEENVTPYVDPMIQKDIMKLTIRMAESGMIRGVCKGIMEVGLFTVVKKVEDDGKVVLRLVLDQRVPNEYRDTPPWSPLSGPGALSSIDLSEEGTDQWDALMMTGDVPDCFYRWGIPEAMSEYFVIPGVSFAALIKELLRLGKDELASKLLKEQGSRKFVKVGLSVIAMGWSWAVFLA